ncbi:MAG: hypothetical protein A2Y33_06440 [Spirochaetes bacterium GWF1_51_8]|nr:MAG: hypothetical protein A2Y33_06440 [Spirochaetes bacterium GWF1_51_8]
MDIKDVITGNVNLAALYDKSKLKASAASLKSGDKKQIGQDSFVFEKNLEKDMIRLQQVQKDYMKSGVGLEGLNEMSKLIGEFEGQDPEKIDWQGASKKMNAVVNSATYDGENVIGFISTKIEDQKSLYTLKMNVQKEIGAMQMKMNDDRKQIASYLVKRENIEVMSGFSPDANAQSVVKALDLASAQGLFKNLGKVNSLLASGK